MKSEIVHLNHSIDQYIKTSPINSKYTFDLPDHDLSDSISQSSSTTLANYQTTPHKYQTTNTNNQSKMNSQKLHSPVKSQTNYPNNHSTPTQNHEISEYSTPIQQIIPPVETTHCQPTHQPILDQKVTVKKQSFYNTTPNVEAGNGNENAPKNENSLSTDSFNDSSDSLKRHDTATSLLSTMSSTKSQVNNKFKRLSGSFARSDVPLTSNKRFSLSNRLKRMSLGYNMPASNKNLHENTSDPPQTKQSPDTKQSTVPYWKYHILKYGKDLYLTTNPGIRHIYCRNGPGYYVEIIYNDKSSKPKISKGFTLVFKDINNIDQSKDYLANTNTKIPVLMTITRKSKVEGGHYTVSIPKANNNTSPGQFNSPMFNGLSIPKAINQSYIPVTNEPIEFVNYEFRDFNNTKWNVGSIPRIKLNKSKYLKNKMSNQNYSASTLNNRSNVSLNSTRPDLQSINNLSASSLTQAANENASSTSINNYTNSSVSLNRLEENPSSTTLPSNGQNPSYQEPYTFIGKKNVFFHQNYVDIESDEQAHNTTYKDKTKDLENIYLERNNDFPPVLAMFRPYEIKMRKRLMQSLNKNKRQLINHIDTNMEHKFDSKNLTNDLGAGSNVKSYYTGGDGLYYVKNPSDDSPDDNKLGWITIYDDPQIFGKHNKGMYQMVLGLTLAVGLERSSEH